MRTTDKAGFTRRVYFALALCCCVSILFASACSHKTSARRHGQGKPVFLKNVEPEQIFALIKESKGDPNFVILDVRTPEEFAQGRIDGAININYYADDFKDKLAGLDKNMTYVVYCRTGRRSAETFEMLRRAGFTAVYHISGGFERWLADDLPILRK